MGQRVPHATYRAHLTQPPCTKPTRVCAFQDFGLVSLLATLSDASIGKGVNFPKDKMLPDGYGETGLAQIKVIKSIWVK